MSVPNQSEPATVLLAPKNAAKSRQPVTAKGSPVDRPKLSSIHPRRCAVTSLCRNAWSLFKYWRNNSVSLWENVGRFARSTRPDCKVKKTGQMLWSNLPSPGTFQFRVSLAPLSLTDESCQK